MKLNKEIKYIFKIMENLAKTMSHPHFNNFILKNISDIKDKYHDLKKYDLFIKFYDFRKAMEFIQDNLEKNGEEEKLDKFDVSIIKKIDVCLNTIIRLERFN